MGGLRFLSPLFLLGALAVAIPIVLHLFRRRNDPIVPFSALRFLHAVPIEQARRRRLQDLLLLALRAAALLLLAAGFARPYFETPVNPSEAGVTIVAVDVSASMGDATRFARALALAGDAVLSAPAGHQVGVLRFAGVAELLVEPGADRDAARAAVTALAPGAGPTRYHAAIARAFDAIGTRRGSIVLVTDLQSSGWAASGGVGSRRAARSRRPDDSRRRAAAAQCRHRRPGPRRQRRPRRTGLDRSGADGGGRTVARSGGRRSPAHPGACRRSRRSHLPRARRPWRHRGAPVR
jgi:hypothetical protein